MQRRSDQRVPDIVPPHGGEDEPFEKQNSLLPGEVRTPSVIVSLQDAWGESGGDWAAPGSSSVWEEESANRYSVQTPLSGYGHGNVWGSPTGSPLMDDGLAPHEAFDQAGPLEDDIDGEAIPHVAVIAAAALQNLSKEENASIEQSGGNGLIAQPCYPDAVHRRVDGGYSAREEPLGSVMAHPPYSHQQERPPELQPNYFTVQEGTTTSAAPLPQRPVSRSGGGRSNSLSGHASLSSMNSSTYVPRLHDAAVVQSIIASAGLPLSMHSLMDYIHEGQPRTLAHTEAIGTTHNMQRNYPNLNEPPGEEDYFGGRGGNTGGARGGRTQRSAYGQPQQDRWAFATTDVANAAGFGIRPRETYGNSGVQQQQQQPFVAPSTFTTAPHSISTGFLVTASNMSQPNAHSGTPHAVPSGGRVKSESEYLSDLLHFHANFFPPPPPPRVPKEERRHRAELWYHYACKWDITHRLPPPPRTPLPEMELEYLMGAPQMTRVPYHGDVWLQMSERWFDVVQSLFDFPEENFGEDVDMRVVLEQAVLS